MKRLLIILSFFLLISSYNAQSISTFMNPVIPGDHPDCTLTRIGDYFYTTGSSFSMTPKIYRSTDLVHWEVVSQPVSNSWSNFGSNPTDGIWGGHVVFYNNKYWHFFGRSGTMYFVTADNVEGPWSSPVAMTRPAGITGLGMDNSIFIDDDGKWYLLAKHGQPGNWIIELGINGQPNGRVYDLTWINPAPNYPFSWAEGPVMWKYKGYYFYSFARNLAGGQYVFRSTTLTGDKSAWENLGDLFGSVSAPTVFPGPNHNSPAVILDDSTSWIMYHSYSTNEWQAQGRQGLMSQVKYNQSMKPIVDFPVNLPMTAPKLPNTNNIPWMVPKSDFFESDKLNPEWSRLGYSPQMNYSLTERPGWLRLLPRNKHNTITKNDAEHNYALITRVDFEPTLSTHEAGIRIMNGLQTLHARLYSTLDGAGKLAVKFQFDRTSHEVENNFGNVVWLKIVRENHLLSGYFSNDGKKWTQVGSSINVASMDGPQPDYNAFTGNRQGLYVIGKQADFDFYIYRDAYTPIMASIPANQFGTKLSGADILDEIHNTDWAMFAGVEFGNDNYLRMPDSVVVNAASTSSGGKIEFWIDSFDNGTKIGEINIENTGDLRTFKDFRVNVQKVLGRHDLYLKFVGAPGEKLFRIKTFNFISADVSTKMKDDNKNTFPYSYSLEQNFPNPFNPATQINYQVKKSSFVTIKVYNLLGQLVANLFEGTASPGTYSVKFDGADLPSGIYLYQMNADNFTDTKKFMLLK